MKRKSFGLKEYSLLTASFILGNKMQAQVIYTDIDPDIFLEDNGETAGVDMNNNGTFDIAFLKTVFTTSTTSSSFVKKYFLVGPYGSPDIAIAGTANYISGYGGSYDYWPYALSKEALINIDLSFQNYGFQKMIFEEAVLEFLIPGCGGEWWPEVKDHYLGLRLWGGDGHYNYGWIRCSIKDSAKVLVIKDYAYEAHAGKPIHAGDTSNLISSFESENNLDASVYAFDQTIFIQLKTKEETQINIYNLLGEKIYTEKINTNTTEIKLKETGIFIVELLSADKKMVKKIVLQ